MICKNCGEKLEKEETVCHKCGSKVKSIKISLNKLIIIVLVLIFVINCIIIANKNNSKNVASQTNTTTTSKNEKLSIIDEKTNCMNINVYDLAKEIVKVRKEKSEYERSMVKSDIYYQEYKYEDKGLIIVEVTSKISQSVGVDPFYMLAADLDTGRLYRLSVSQPFLNDYGTAVNTSAIENSYSALYTALNNLGYQELSNTIKWLYDTATDGTIHSDLNYKGISFGTLDGTLNKYGNPKGIYFIYGTK